MAFFGLFGSKKEEPQATMNDRIDFELDPKPIPHDFVELTPEDVEEMNERIAAEFDDPWAGIIDTDDVEDEDDDEGVEF